MILWTRAAYRKLRNETNAREYVSQIGRFIRGKLPPGLNGVVLGMSGGIDCSVVARLCQVAGVDAKLYILPDGNTPSQQNAVSDAMLFIDKFGFDYENIDIGPICAAIETALGDTLCTPGLAFSNIPPRVRMTVLYTAAQSLGRLVIGTGNLAERLMGYFTKWGDGAYDLNPLGMMTKTEVRTLARELQVPDTIINKAPSAGLYEGQTDEADMGLTYEEIDSFILNGTSGNNQADLIIKQRIALASHKLNAAPIFNEKLY